MSTSYISLLAAFLALGYSFHQERAANRLDKQVADLQTQIKQLQKDSQFTTNSEQSSHLNRSLQATGDSCTCHDGFTYASDFGVVGNAGVDDTMALQAAIDSASSNDGGGIVILPKGTFRM